MSHWIDVTVALKNGMPGWPGDHPFEIRRVQDMAAGAAYNLSQLCTSAHAGTHMDAPLHFVDGAASIDAMPIGAGIGPARVVRIEDPERIPIDELERASIQPGERILFRTRMSDTAWPGKDFLPDFVAIPEDSAHWLAARRPLLIGVDYLSIGPFADGGPTHRAILGAGIWVIEGLDLSKVEPGLYDLVCLPLKLAGAEGAPARVVLRRRPR